MISPGPGDPHGAGSSIEAVGACARAGTPLLGVCLGHQSIGVAFGGRIVRARSIMHGKVSDIEHDRVTATVQLPDRVPAKAVLLCLRHPRGKLIKTVAVNGSAWTEFDTQKEAIRLSGRKGTVAIEVGY